MEVRGCYCCASAAVGSAKGRRRSMVSRISSSIPSRRSFPSSSRGWRSDSTMTGAIDSTTSSEGVAIHRNRWGPKVKRRTTPSTTCRSPWGTTREFKRISIQRGEQQVCSLQMTDDQFFGWRFKLLIAAWDCRALLWWFSACYSTANAGVERKRPDERLSLHPVPRCRTSEVIRRRLIFRPHRRCCRRVPPRRR